MFKNVEAMVVRENARGMRIVVKSVNVVHAVNSAFCHLFDEGIYDNIVIVGGCEFSASEYADGQGTRKDMLKDIASYLSE